MDFGKRLKELRMGSNVDGRRVSQKKLAEMSGVCINTIAYIEVGKIKNPGIKNIEKLMSSLGLTLKDFVK